MTRSMGPTAFVLSSTLLRPRVSPSTKSPFIGDSDGEVGAGLEPMLQYLTSLPSSDWGKAA